MLESAIVAYVEALTERELDLPLRALLRAEGFTDLELVHGVTEYGRDFIGKSDRDGVLRQFSLQSKAGDLSLCDWRKVREQLEDIRTVPLRHPMFDAELPGTIVLVTTGALSAQAREAADGYANTLPEPWRFELWTRGRLVELLGRHLEAALAERARGPLLSLLGAIDNGDLELRALETHSRRWIPAPGDPVAVADLLEAALLAARARAADRLDLACGFALGAIRAQLVAYSDENPLSEGAAAQVKAAGEFFALYAEALWERCDDALLTPEAMVNTHPEFGFWVTYAVRSTRLAELLGLLGLWRTRQGEDVDELASWLARFLASQPGAAHPVSDRHALSLAPPGLLLADRPAVLTDWLRETVRWTADRYDGASLGLASVEATPEVEVDYLLGDLEHVEHPERRESLIAGLVLDLASTLELEAVYEDARHEFQAVHAAPDVRHPPGGRDAWLRDGDGLRQEINAAYTERYGDRGGWATAPHHDAQPEPWVLSVGLEWEALASWCLLRDRWQADVLRTLVETRRP